MNNLWAPWRIEYIRGDEPDGCFICRAVAASEDRRNLLLYRGKTSCVVLNKYPYNNGHLMVAPYRHVAGLEDLTDAERLELMHLTEASIRVLRSVMRPEGFNIGINVGGPAGAGLKEHVHQHVVPRWVGDTNFMPVLTDLKVIPQALATLWDELHPRFAEAGGGGKENG